MKNLKNLFSRHFCIIIIFLLATINTSAQLYEVDDEIIYSEASVVIEGEIIESECFRTAKGDIYTAHKVKIYKSFNELPNSNFLSIVTRGGTLGNETQTWTHLLTLHEGSKGVFFLHSTKSPSSILNKVTDDYYSVVASEQGYIRYNFDETGLSASTPFRKFPNVQKDVFEKIEKIYEKPHQKYAEPVWSYHVKTNKSIAHSYSSKMMDEDGRCLEFLFEVLSPDINNPMLVSTVVSIKASEVTKITKPVVVTKYSTNALGTNIYTSGLITLEQIGISADLNYTSIAEDIAPDKVKIEISANSLNEPDLYVITTEYTPLKKLIFCYQVM